MKSALVVIDVQNYFVNDKTKDLPSKIAAFIENNIYDYVLFSQFVNESGSNFFKLLNWQKNTSSPEIDIDPAFLRFAKPENTFKKSTYSIFKANGLKEFLDRENITKLDLCGIDTDSCVLASAYDAFDLGYEVKVLKDLSLSHSGEDFHNAAIKIIDKSIQK